MIERARSAEDRASGYTFDNFYNVSLEKPTAVTSGAITTTSQATMVDSVMIPPTPPAGFQAGMSSMAPMFSQMYASMMDAQLKFYSDPATTKQLAKITKNYYDALIKIGFSSDQAFKIVISKPLVSTETAGKQ